MKTLHEFKIGVIAGGTSSEREISLVSGTAVFKALQRKGFNVVFIDVTQNMPQQILNENIDIAFIALHGKEGENGTIQQFLSEYGIAFTGSGPLSSKVCMDKELTKKILSDNNILVPPYMIVNKEQYFNIDSYEFGLPVVIKPATEGSSFGLSIVIDKKDIKTAMNKAFQYGNTIIFEEFIDGKELTVGILGKSVLPVVEIIAKDNVYDFNAKYIDKQTEYICPAELSDEKKQEISDIALLTHNTLGCEDFSRVDMRMDHQGKIYVLEVNTIPGLTERSLLPKAAKVFGISFDELCEQILELAVFKKVRYGQDDEIG
ncbi:MAG: D-alanine--D-alanine ligase [Candidatus Omnitrophica bacterium]|jgi:D-alanine-D-alanine ligase|nr:D-alanine--D-alanine ligase [Candidatus Omnitrophota bacterium]